MWKVSNANKKSETARTRRTSRSSRIKYGISKKRLALSWHMSLVLTDLSQITRLKKQCSVRDEQLTAAQDMRTRLMSAMGLGIAAPQLETVQSTLPIRSASSGETSRPTPRQSSVAEQESAFEALDGTSDQPRQGSPKRAKPRKAFKVPALYQHRENMSSSRRSSRLSRAGELLAHRVPLSESSVNLSPIRKTPGKVAFKDMQHQGTLAAEQDLKLVEGWSFSTDIMTGTPGAGLGLSGEDDSTVET
ncbi:hypothetical protein ANO11243_084010 [Dothideomycetidae sp. 11243]|nr:hypothetical protein ANO11243_084010 [fungal sp. No.11243]